MNKLMGILKWVLLLGYFPVMLAFVSVSHQSVVCSEVNVIVKDSAQARFVNAEDVRKSILNAYPSLLGGTVSELNFDEMEAFVNQHSAIRSTQVYNSGSGVLNVMVTQHEPLLRVFAAEGTFYLDETGRQVPVSSNFSAHVLVVSGTVPKDRSDLVKVAGMLANDPFWTAQMEQIYIRRNNEYILVPRVGDHLILLGQPEDVEKKLRNLKVLYTSGLDPKEWNEYQVINLKYKNQVICSRKRTL
jgi:cell division protein FtsQ